MFKLKKSILVTILVITSQAFSQFLPVLDDATRFFSEQLFDQPIFQRTTKFSTDLLASFTRILSTVPNAFSRIIGPGIPPLLISDTNLASLSDNFIAEYYSGLENEDVRLPVDELILKYGYPLEKHRLATEDGYILTVFRIPSEGPPVFLMHGLAGSGDDFVLAGPESGLAYLLADEGYDVWIGNARGTKYSRDHKQISPSKTSFWDFSWHEIGYYDLPAMIDHVLVENDLKNLTYIGHSQGTTSFFVMASERPEYNEKISLMIALSPVAYMTNVKSPVIRLVSPLGNFLHVIANSIGMVEFFPNNAVSRILKRVMCGQSAVAEIMCSNLMFLIGGFSFGHLNVSNLAVLFNHMPSGAAAKQFAHYGQGVVSKDFRQFDYGPLNFEKYGQEAPPKYDLENIRAPVSLWYSTGDWLADKQDVLRLYEQLPNVVDLYEIPDDTFNHVDFLFAKDFKEIIYYRLHKLLIKLTEN